MQAKSNNDMKFTLPNLEENALINKGIAQDNDTFSPDDVALKQFKRRGRPLSDDTKVAVSIRLSSQVLDYFRQNGKGWQTRINDTLEHWVRQQTKS